MGCPPTSVSRLSCFCRSNCTPKGGEEVNAEVALMDFVNLKTAGFTEVAFSRQKYRKYFYAHFLKILLFKSTAFFGSFFKLFVAL